MHTIWQCEFEKHSEDDPNLQQFLSDRLPEFSKKQFPSKCTYSDILDSVLDDTFFGLLEVDIQIPNSWDEVKYKPNTTLSPRDWFDEMAPLFVTTEVPYQSIGKHMKEHVKTHGLSQSSRTLLVAGLKAKKLLLFSPLLKWYIEHGLLVTRIFEVIEYVRQKCFSNFVDFITKARREGYIDKTNEMIGTLCKLLGNSASIGSTLCAKKIS